MTLQEAMEYIRREDPEYFDYMTRVMSDGIGTEEPIVITGHHEHLDLAGSKRTACRACHAQIWLSPWALEIIAKRGERTTIVLCQPCGLHLQRVQEVDNDREDCD